MTIDREIKYSRFNRDYDCYVDGRYVGSRATYSAGETLCNQVATDLIADGLALTAEQLDSTQAEQVPSTPEPVGNICQSCGCTSLTWFCPACEQLDDAQAAEPCKMNVLGTRWTVCGAPAEGPCYCDVVVKAQVEQVPSDPEPADEEQGPCDDIDQPIDRPRSTVVCQQPDNLCDVHDPCPEHAAAAAQYLADQSAVFLLDVTGATPLLLDVHYVLSMALGDLPAKDVIPQLRRVQKRVEAAIG